MESGGRSIPHLLNRGMCDQIVCGRQAGHEIVATGLIWHVVWMESKPTFTGCKRIFRQQLHMILSLLQMKYSAV